MPDKVVEQWWDVPDTVVERTVSPITQMCPLGVPNGRCVTLGLRCFWVKNARFFRWCWTGV